MRGSILLLCHKIRIKRWWAPTRVDQICLWLMHSGHLTLSYNPNVAKIDCFLCCCYRLLWKRWLSMSLITFFCKLHMQSKKLSNFWLGSAQGSHQNFNHFVPQETSTSVWHMKHIHACSQHPIPGLILKMYSNQYSVWYFTPTYLLPARPQRGNERPMTPETPASDSKQIYPEVLLRTLERPTKFLPRPVCFAHHPKHKPHQPLIFPGLSLITTLFFLLPEFRRQMNSLCLFALTKIWLSPESLPCLARLQLEKWNGGINYYSNFWFSLSDHYVPPSHQIFSPVRLLPPGMSCFTPPCCCQLTLSLFHST